MCDDDEQAFYTLLLETDQSIRPGCAARTPGAMVIIFQDLQQYNFDTVKKAMGMHRRDPERGQWPPNSAHIEHQINIRRPITWLSADEAWARISKPGKPVKQKDGKINYGAAEPGPCLLTSESAQALAAATSLLESGDDIAARMAFKGCYERLIERAKLERRGPVYFVSPGGSYEEQEAVKEEGQRLGLLAAPPKVPELALPKPRTHGAKPDLKALLLSMKSKEMPPPEPEDYER